MSDGVRPLISSPSPRMLVLRRFTPSAWAALKVGDEVALVIKAYDGLFTDPPVLARIVMPVPRSKFIVEPVVGGGYHKRVVSRTGKGPFISPITDETNDFWAAVITRRQIREFCHRCSGPIFLERLHAETFELLLQAMEDHDLRSSSKGLEDDDDDDDEEIG